MEEDAEVPRTHRSGVLQLRVVTGVKMNRRETVTVTKEAQIQHKAQRKALCS